MWQGLGVNYKGARANWPADATYLKSVGVTTIRPSLSSFPNSAYTAGSQGEVIGSIEWWRQCAEYFQSQGFIVVYGIARVTGVSGTFDATAWATYRANVLADAAYNQSIGFEPDFYQIGNEIEGIINNTTYTQTQLISDLKTLATDLQPYISANTKLVYSTYDLSSTMFDNWVSDGRGDIDVLGGNVYAQTSTNGKGFIFGDMGRLGLMIKTFGAEHFILTEFGITGNAAEYAAARQSNRARIMKHIYAGIRELGFTTAIAYSYVGYLNGDNDFALKNTDGTFDVQWGILLNDGGKSHLVTVGGETKEVHEAKALAPAKTAVATAKTVVTIPARRVYAIGKGNFTAMHLTPVDMTPLRLGTTFDFSVVFRGKLRKKTATGDTSSHTIARCDYNNGTNLGYIFQVTASSGRLRVLSGSTTYDSAVISGIYDADVEIILTLTGSTLRGYVNGVLVTWFTSGTTTQTITRKDNAGNNNNFFLAENGAASSTAGGVRGQIHEIMSVRRALSQAEIDALGEDEYPSDLDIRYDFTRGAGRWVADLSGNNNHGLMANENWRVFI